MRILFACGDYYPNLGGVTSLVNDLAKLLLRSGHEVTVLTRACKGAPPIERWNNYDIVRFDFPMLFERIDIHRHLILRSPKIFCQVANLLLRRRIDTVCIGLLDASAVYLLQLRQTFGFRMILYLHGSDVRKLPVLEPSYRRVLNNALDAADATIAVSEELAREAAAYLPSARSKIQVIHNGVDVAGLRSIEPRTHPRDYIAFVGRLVMEKDLDTLLDAFQAAAPNIGEVDLVIAGWGNDLPRLQAKARDAGIEDRVHFLGRVEREEAYAVIKGALLMLLPSRTEGHPIVAMEARAAGKPLIGSRIPGIARLVEEGRTGVLFTQGNAGELAALIEKYCRDRAALAELASGVRASDLSGFDIESLFPRHVEAFLG